jgi:hypothetical protein
MGAPTNLWPERGTTSRYRLFELLPMFPTEKASESGGQRRPFVMGGVGMQDEGTLGGGQIRHFFVCQRTTYERGGDLGNLIPVHKSQPVLRLDRDAVKEIKFRYLQNMLDGPELGLRGAQHCSALGQSLVRNRTPLVHGNLLTSDCGPPGGDRSRLKGIPPFAEPAWRTGRGRGGRRDGGWEGDGSREAE